MELARSSGCDTSWSGTDSDVASLDDTQPVLVGISQVTHRIETHEEAAEAVDLMEWALRRALEDSGCDGLLSAIQWTAVIQGVWSYPDPGRFVLERLGAGGRTSLTEQGGQQPQALLVEMARRIVAGELEVGLCLGAEVVYSRRRAREAGKRLSRSAQQWPPADRWGRPLPVPVGEREGEVGLDPVGHAYAIFESAIRAGRGTGLNEHRAFLGRLYEGFSRVASGNPHSWLREAQTAEVIAEPVGANRMVAYPYTRAMVSNPQVNQAAAIIVCSAGRARALGIPRDRWVFLHAATAAEDTHEVSARQRLDGSPALTAAAGRCLELAGVGIDGFGAIDLYSCFPSMVQMTAEALGLSTEQMLSRERPLTVTGGMSFFGGPLHSYVLHTIVSVAATLRQKPGELGLVHANGGAATKQVFGVYSTEPPNWGFRYEALDGTVDLEPRRALYDYRGTAEIEGYTVSYDREGPKYGIVLARTPDGGRAPARIEDADEVGVMTSAELVGRPVTLRGDGMAALE